MNKKFHKKKINFQSKVDSNDLKNIVEQYSKDDGMNIINSNEHILKVSKDMFHVRNDVIVCNGTFDRIPVAVKITEYYDYDFYDEMKVYKVLNDTDAESHGIPKIYYYGKAFENSYNAIAMSLFEGTVYDRYKNKTIFKPLSEFSVLLIFKQAVIIFAIKLTRIIID